MRKKLDQHKSRVGAKRKTIHVLCNTLIEDLDATNSRIEKAEILMDFVDNLRLIL